MSRRKIAMRLYLLTAAMVVTTMAALIVLPRFVSSPRYLEPQAALVQNMVDWLARNQHDATRFDAAMARVSARLHGELTLYDPAGHVVRSTGTTTVDGPSAVERDTLHGDAKWALSYHRIVVRSDDRSMIGVYLPAFPGFPWAFILPLGAGVLAVAGAATLWFSRRLVRPLGKLADAARRFGGGQTEARAELRRDDELGDLGRAFDDMADRTASLITAQRQLMADVSHELRTPLARIRVALELAAEDPGAAKELLTEVGGDLDEIDQLIADILTTARLDAEPQLARHATPVGDVADQAAERFRTRHPGRALERTGEPAERAIECDPALLRRALDNLLDNAAKYSDAPVTLAVHPNGTAVAFEVVDRGIGMSPDELERAGTPFWRADSCRSRKTGGVGLGLALARRIARAHGGDVTLASEPGRGTTARLEIPFAARSEGPGGVS